ncbi:uncharacterized protein [Ambystoma mexicanum]|uniref:uncharacterized protein isoform X1 n=1 Tax=Ambystoma mexicanum TaxID=8296 RepID=UPI0037E7E298
MIETFHYDWCWREVRAGRPLQQNIPCLTGIHEESIVYFPRVVGGKSPEIGNHFILWIFNGKRKMIQIFDSLGTYLNINEEEMEIISNIFIHIWDLKKWKIEIPTQWIQKDSESCGVFVCTTTDTTIRGIEMALEELSQDNLCHLRRYHASCLMTILQQQVIVPQRTNTSVDLMREVQKVVAFGLYRFSSNWEYFGHEISLWLSQKTSITIGEAKRKT